MKVYLATTLTEAHQGRVLSKKNAFRRLLSYWFTKEKKHELVDYVEIGKKLK